MSEHRTGPSGSRKPDPKKPDNAGWYSWPVIIVLFATGLWPIALLVMFFNIFGEEKRKKTSGTQRRPSVESRMEQSVESAVERAMARAEERRKSAAAAPASRTRKEAAETAPRTGKKSTGKTKKGKATKGKLPGKLLRVLGICTLVLGMILSVSGTADMVMYGPHFFDELMAGLGFLLAGGIMWGRGQYLARVTRRSQRYIMAIGNVDAMPLGEIAKRVNRTPAKAGRELQKLIDKGYLGEDAYIDHEKGWFLRFGATVQEPVTPEQAPAEEVEKGYSGILRNIRRANDRIADEALSRKIGRLEQISALIFREVEEHPEKRSRIRTFFDYYLPTTQKLLDAYAEFEQTGVEGENLREAKKRIEQTMDAIVEGFEHQLDQLYSADAMDVVSDIKVMETMLQRDTGSAAKDFGYDQVDAKTKTGNEGVTLEL